MTLGPPADQWIAGKINLKPTTRARYESALNVHVRPRWSTTPLAKIAYSDVQAWLAGLLASEQSSASVRKSYGVLSGVLALAVRDKRIPSNPADGIDLPALVERERRYLTAALVEALAAAAATLRSDRPQRASNAAFAQYRLVVLVLTYCGLRGRR